MGKRQSRSNAEGLKHPSSTLARDTQKIWLMAEAAMCLEVRSPLTWTSLLLQRRTLVEVDSLITSDLRNSKHGCLWHSCANRSLC
jgi:hypothetical protein